MENQLSLPIAVDETPRQHIDFPLKPLATDTMKTIQADRASGPARSMTGRRRIWLGDYYPHRRSRW